MRFGISFRQIATLFGVATLWASVGCAPTTPVLLLSVPEPATTFSLNDSVEVIRRVQQVFYCSTPTNSLSTGTLGWRRDSDFVDITVMQDLRPAGPNGEPAQICWKGFRVDAAGRIFALPTKSWPYTAFRKRPSHGPIL